MRELGRGGMGVVYEAEQDAPRRRVALKVIHRWLMSDRVLRRFDREAEVLGRLDHPGIARIFDAGAARVDGQVTPFFAMELVEGLPIDAHVQQMGLGIRETVELLAFVCDAIHHAHQRGVIHRDIKPGNVMVTRPADDSATERDRSGESIGTGTSITPSAGCPKVLDFGVAKLVESDRDAGTLDTMPGNIVGTPAYMSPEQLESGSAAVDTRDDVYSLGVLLYSVFAQRLPTDLAGVPVSEAARRVREASPPMLGQVAPLCRGDIETIVHNAMDPDRDRRYSSVAGLAEDLRRFLRDAPIEARPSSTLYKLRKFARRNRTLVALGAALVVVLITAASIASYFAVSEHAARQEAVQLAAASSIAAADAALREEDTVTATARLESVDPAARNWIWRYLWAKKDQSVAAARLGDPNDDIGWQDRSFGEVEVWMDSDRDVVHVARTAVFKTLVQSFDAASLDTTGMTAVDASADWGRLADGGYYVFDEDGGGAFDVLPHGERVPIGLKPLPDGPGRFRRFIGVTTDAIREVMVARALKDEFGGWVSTSDDGRWIYTWAGDDAEAYLLDVHGTGRRIIIPQETEGVPHAAFSADGRFMVTAGTDRKLRCYDLDRTLELVWERDEAHTDAILAAAW
ncbi:MAG: serine/threonine-protein kinase, partial [Planctomycetota bacterium]